MGKVTADERPRWRKSSFSGVGNCVEAAEFAGRVLVRDSKNPQGPMLTFTRPEFDAFVAGVKNGDFDGLMS